MAKLLSGSKLDAAIVKLAVDAGKMAEHIHMLACSVAVEAVRTNNVTCLNQFNEATLKVGKRAVMRWLAKHAPVKLNDAKDAFIMNDTRIEKAKALGLDAYGEGLFAGPSYYTEQKANDTNPFKPFDLDAILMSALARAEDAAGDAERNAKAEVNTERLDALREFIRKNVPVKLKTKAGKKAKETKSGVGASVPATAAEIAEHTIQ